jgi:hypothetical protein
MTVVLMGDPPPEPIEIRTNLRDQLRFEDAARKGKWGPMTDNLLRFETHVAWSACRRTKQIPDDTTYEQFADLVEQIDSTVISPRPTRTEASTGST